MTELLIDANAFERNTKKIIEAAGDAEVYGMVKGNGYGLGLVNMALLLIESGVSTLALTTLQDALKLREADIKNDIILFCPLYNREELEAAIDADIILTVACTEGAELINSTAEAMGKLARAHIGIDTGFGRYGFQPDCTQAIIDAVNSCSSISFDGIFTHYYDAFGKKAVRTKKQYDLFMSVCSKLEDAGIKPQVRHTANTAALFNHPYTRLDAVRAGSAFLGRTTAKGAQELERIGVLRSEIGDIYDKPAGQNYGYGGVFISKKPLRTAVVPAGTVHGYGLEQTDNAYRFSDTLRYISHNINDFLKHRCAYVTVKGKRCRVLGQIGLCSVIIDVTDVDCNRGDEVLLQVNTLRVNNDVPRVIIR